MRQTDIRAYCPYCYRTALHAVDPHGEHRPTSGDVGVCQYCDNVVMFDFGRRSNVLRRPRPGERIAMRANPKLQAMLMVRAQHKRAASRVLH